MMNEDDKSTQPVQPVEPTTSMQLEKSSAKKKLIIIVAVIGVVLAVLSGGVLAYVNRLNNQPEKVLADALANTTADLLARKPATLVSKITYDSKEEKRKFTLDLDLKNVGEDGSLKADLQFQEGETTLNLKAETIVFGQEEIYFKLERLEPAFNLFLKAYSNNFKKRASLTGADPAPVQAQVNALGQLILPVIKKMDGQWIKVSIKDIEKTASQTSDLSDCSEAVKNVRLTGDDQKKLKSIFKENQFIEVKDEYNQETVAGAKSFHYLVDFNKKSTETFFKEAATLESFKKLVNDCDIDSTKAESSSTDTTKKAEKVKFELWVDNASRRFSKIRAQASDKELTVDFATELSFDADLKLSKPKKSITLEELQKDIQTIFAGLLPQ